MLPQDSDSRGSGLEPVRRADPHPEGEEEEPLHILPSERLHLLREREAPRAFPIGHGPGEGLRRRLERPRPDEAIDATRAIHRPSSRLADPRYHLSHRRTISARFISVHVIANDRDRANSVPQDSVGVLSSARIPAPFRRVFIRNGSFPCPMAAMDAIYQQLTILLALATLSHFTIKRFRHPTIVGEILLGILLGPTILFHYLNIQLFDANLVSTFAGLGSIFLLFLIGLESDFKAIYTRKNVAVASGGVILPFALGFVSAYILVPISDVGPNGTQFTMAIFVGATLTATSTAIAAAVLLELGLMREPIAHTIMGAAVVDDILSLVLLSIVTGASGGRLDPLSIGLLLATALLFLGVGMAVGLYFFRKVVVRIQVAGLKLGLKHGGFIIAITITFLYAFIAEVIGLSAIVGAFLAG